MDFLIYTGVKMLFSKAQGVHPEKNPVIKVAQRIFPVSSNFVGAKFFTRLNGRRALTPLALVLLMVETTDLIFALDSIPAIFVVTTKPFIVFTSNIFAILGLRSLYFVLVGAFEYFRYLKFGLALVLVFIGAKMAAEIWDLRIPTTLSLIIVGGILLIAVAASILLVNREPPAPEPKQRPPPEA